MSVPLKDDREVPMKKLKYAALLCSVAVLLVAVGCKSTPPATDDTTTQPAPDSKVDEELTALRDRVEALRNECLQYKLDTMNPTEWAAAEASRAAGLEAYGKDYALAKTSFETAISQYEALKAKSLEAVVAGMEESIKAARDAAVAAGAEDYYPEQFALADQAADEARAAKDAGDLQAAYDKANLALMRYQTLERLMLALEMKEKVDENEFQSVSPDEYARAGERHADGVAAYGTEDAAALDAATESLALYKSVNNKGFEGLTKDMIVKADEIRALCDSIKAEKTMKDAYAEAATSYSKGASFAQSNDFEPAYEAYSEAAVGFTDVYQEASLKRNSAEAAMQRAKEKQASSADLARKADEVAPIPEGTEGYSDEPIVVEEETK